MTKFFVGLYNYFERHKVLFYLSLSVCILFMALFAAQVRFEENVTSFFPDTKDSQNAINVFENLKIKDKIMIMLSGKDGVADADSLIEAAETIKQDLQQQAEGTLIKEIFSKADENLRQAQLGYKEGVMTLDNVMAAQTAWLKANSENIDAEIDVQLCNVYLSKVTGTLKY